ncbi:MAG: helix-turn-helix domain-containing protein [Bacillota bacterium]
MRLSTFDEKRNISLPIYFEKDEKFIHEDFSSFKFILVSSGTAITELNKRKIVIMAPVVFCLNDEDVLNIIEHHDLKARAVYFDPIVVNNVLTIENIKNTKCEMSESEYRDYYLLLPFITRSDESIGLINIDILTAQRIGGLMSSLELELTALSNDFWRCRTRSFFLEILFFLQYIWTDNKAENKFEIYDDSNIAKKILLYLHANYERKLTLKHLTEVFHVNRTTLTEEFQRATNSSIIDYLIKLRVYMASIMIKNTDLPINEIMYRNGFHDNTHFGRMFKKHTGYSPSEYRMNFRM